MQTPCLALLPWHTELWEAHTDVPLPKTLCILPLTELSFETRFMSPCPGGFEQQNFSP